MKMTKKSKIIGAALVSCLLIGGGSVYYANEQKKAEQERIYVDKINDQVDSISKDLAKFEKESEENKKFEQLKSLISEFEEYKNGDEKDEKVIKKYQASIETARQFFKEENEKQIEDNTPKELEKESISDLKVKTDTLNKLNEKIKNQKEIVYSEQEIQELNQKIGKLIKDFSDRIKELEKKEVKEKQQLKNATSDPNVENVASEKKQSENSTVAGDNKYQESSSFERNSNTYSEKNNSEYVNPAPSISNGDQSNSSNQNGHSTGTIWNGYYDETGTITKGSDGVTITVPGGSVGGFH